MTTFKKFFYDFKTEADFIKKYFLAGLISYKENVKDYSAVIRICGICCWMKKIKFGKVKFYIFGIRYFKKSTEDQLYTVLLKLLKDKYTEIYINFNCSGETYLSLAYLKPGSNSVFIATKRYHVDLCRMLHPDVDCIYLPELIKLRAYNNTYKTIYKGKTFYNILPFNHFQRLEKKLVLGLDVHYCEEICKTIGIKYPSAALHPVISDEARHSALEKAGRICLDLNNFVFLCPESQSNENPPDNTWLDLTDKLYKAGYDIFINAIKLQPYYGMGKSCFLTFNEAYYIASLSKKIIGLRNGFIEVLTTLGDVPIVCLYTDFKSRGLLSPIRAEIVLSGFTLKKLPNVNPDNICEVICKR